MISAISTALTPANGSSSRISLRLEHHHAAELQQLLLAAGQLAGRHVGDLVELEEVEHAFGLLAHLALARRERAARRTSRLTRCSPGWSGAAT